MFYSVKIICAFTNSCLNGQRQVSATELDFSTKIQHPFIVMYFKKVL